MQQDRLFNLIRKATNEKKLLWEKEHDVYRACLRDHHALQFNLTLVFGAWSIKLWVSRGDYIGWERRISYWRKSPEEKMFLRAVYDSAAYSDLLNTLGERGKAVLFTHEISDVITSLLETPCK